MSNPNTNNTLQTQTSNALHNAMMEAGGKDRPPMLAPGNYVQWKSQIKRYIDTKPNNEHIHYCLQNPPYKFKWNERSVPEAEAVQITLTWIDNDIYSTVDTCLNACEMWKAIERLKQRELINVQDLETNLYWEFRNSHYEMLRAERLARTANPLAPIAQQQPVYHPQNHPNHYTHNSSSRPQQAPTKNIVNSSTPTYDQEPVMVAEDDEMSKEKEINKLMALISLSFKKIYKPTNNNLRTSLNTSRANQDNTPIINRGIRYDNQRAVNVAGARENVGTQVKDAVYHKEKMLLCKQEEIGFQLNADQVDWKDDTDEEHDDRELETHYMYMAQIKSEIEDFKNKNKSLESSNNHFKEATTKLAKTNQLMFKDIKKFQDELDRYHDVNYASKVELDCAQAKGELIFYKMSSEKSFNEYIRKINDLSQTISDMKQELVAHKEKISIMSQEKKAQKKFYKTREDKEIEKVIALENKVKVLDDIVYKTGQSVQTMNMLNRNCKMSFVKPEFLKKSQRANPRQYDIGCYNDNLALMLAPESDESIRLAQESRLKLNPFIQTTIEGNFSPQISAILANFEKFHLCLKEEMVDDLRYFNSLELEVDSLKSHLETQKTQFLNEINRLSGEYYYVDHMNAILGVYIKLDEVTNLQCDYLDQVEKCDRLEKELLIKYENVNNKSFNELSKRFSALEQHSINLELALQQRVIATTSVSRPKLKSNQLEDRVLHNNSEVKAKEVEEHRRNSKTKQPIAVPISVSEPKEIMNQSVAISLKKIVASESTNKKPRKSIRKLHEHASKTFN
ncbi:hypothetical protein Tco_1320603 [Tanacetum coccineum]